MDQPNKIKPDVNSEELDKRLKQIIHDLKVVGLSAAIVNKDKMVWEGYYGQANIEADKKINPHTVYRIASISKSILATALMQLQEQGKFKLNDDISDYLGYKVRNPKYPDTPITFTQLATHTSSLQDKYLHFIIASYVDEPPSLREVLVPGGKYYSDEVWGDYEPGTVTKFFYSNLASLVVGTLVEAISGERFDLYCKKHIFDPLGMKETSFYIEDLNMQEIAILYNYDAENRVFVPALDSAGKNRPPLINLSNHKPGTNAAVFSPQGGCRSTARDLVKFLLAHMNGGTYNGVQILKKETVELMHSEHWKGVAEDSSYRKKGIHFQITDDLLPGVTLIGHGGDAWGLISGLYFDKDRQRGIVFLTNGSELSKPGLFFTIAEQITEALFTI